MYHEARRFEDFQAEAVFALRLREPPLRAATLLANAFPANFAAPRGMSRPLRSGNVHSVAMSARLRPGPRWADASDLSCHSAPWGLSGHSRRLLFLLVAIGVQILPVLHGGYYGDGCHVVKQYCERRGYYY